MIYKKPCLRELSGKAASFCNVGSGASGARIVRVQCDVGNNPDVNATPYCGNGSGDSEEYSNACANGTAWCTVSACRIGNDVI